MNFKKLFLAVFLVFGFSGQAFGMQEFLRCLFDCVAFSKPCMSKAREEWRERQERKKRERVIRVESDNSSDSSDDNDRVQRERRWRETVDVLGHIIRQNDETKEDYTRRWNAHDARGTRFEMFYS